MGVNSGVMIVKLPAETDILPGVARAQFKGLLHFIWLSGEKFAKTSADSETKGAESFGKRATIELEKVNAAINLIESALKRRYSDSGEYAAGKLIP